MNNNSMNIATVELLTALVIFSCGFGSTLCPLVIADKSEAFFSVGNMMASGVLLAAGLCHQLSDSSEALDNDKFPWSFFLCGLTFLLFMVFEEAVHLLLAGDHSHENGVIEMETSGGATSLTESLLFSSSCRGSIAIAPLAEIIEEDEHYQQQHTHDHSHHDERQPLKLRRSVSGRGAGGHACRSSLVASFRNSRHASGSRLSLFGEMQPRQSIHHHHDDHISEHLHGSFLASVMLLMALSVHSVLAGLSMGISTSIKSITSTAIAIIAHKVFAGYALGSTMVAAELSLDRHVGLGLVFATSTPLGILIGQAFFSHSYKEDSTPVGIVQAIVAGTFLYVAIIEVGMKELLICRHDITDSSWIPSLTEKQMEAIKLGGMLFGFLAMSFLALYV